MNYEKLVEKWNTETVDEISSLKEKVNPLLEKYADTMKSEVLDDIPQSFGEFLYTALGDRVTGQRSSTLNTEYFASNERGKELAEKATKNKTSIEYELKADYIEQDYPNRNYGYYSSPHQSHLTTGRKFGVSYMTGKKGERMHTMYFGTGKCFSYLKQGHIDCIKNKEKRKLAQDFMDYKNEFVTGKEMFSDNLITLETPIDIKTRELSVITKQNKINRGYNYNRENNSTLVMDEAQDFTITHILIDSTTVDFWDGYSQVDSRYLKSETGKHPTFISMIFLNIDDDNDKITILGNVDLDSTGAYNSLDIADVSNDQSLLRNSPSSKNFYRITDSKAMHDKYRNYDSQKLGGFISNLDEVLTDDRVTDILDEAVGFYKDISEKLQEIKHDNATLFFLNGDM